MRGDFSPFISFQIRDQFFQLLFSKDSENLRSLDIGLREVRAKRRLNRMNKGKKKKNLKLFFSLRKFCTIYEQKFSNLRALLLITFPQEFWKSKKFGHLISRNGGKKTIKGSEKHQKSGSLRQNLPKNKLIFARQFFTLY